MGTLDSVPLFAGVGADTLARLHSRLGSRHFAAGEVILRAGAESSLLFGVVAGAVRVELGGGQGRRLLLVAPQCFGELSALTGDPVSATVVAHRDTQVWTLTTADLLAELKDDGIFFRNLASMLGQRLRHRTRTHRTAHMRVVMLPVIDWRDELLARHLHAGVGHYLPGSTLVDARAGDAAAAAQAIAAAIDTAVGDTVTLLLVERAAADALAPTLRPEDAILDRGADPRRHWRADQVAWRWDDEGLDSPDAEWRHGLDLQRLGREPESSARRPDDPALDRLVRRLCGREIGLALSVGAAAGLAHLGLLEVLEDEGVPIDYLCGSSMGGAVALAYAHFGRARDAIDAMSRLAKDFSRDRGLSLMPRASLLGADRIAAIADELFGQQTFARLGRPAAVVATDLVAGGRVVIDRGRVGIAARATTAIPGLFAPVRLGNAVLVDGGVVTRVPSDLLLARGCGCKLASLVQPEESDASASAAAADQLERRLERPFGLHVAMGGAWRLLGWWDSAAQSERADLALRIATPPLAGFKFDAAPDIVACGRRAALRQIGAIRAVLRRALQPGVP